MDVCIYDLKVSFSEMFSGLCCPFLSRLVSFTDCKGPESSGLREQQFASSLGMWIWVNVGKIEIE